MVKKIFKNVVWQAFCLCYCVLVGRLWFGSWEVSTFSVFLCVSLIPVMWCFDRVWREKSKEILEERGKKTYVDDGGVNFRDAYARVVTRIFVMVLTGQLDLFVRQNRHVFDELK